MLLVLYDVLCYTMLLVVSESCSYNTEPH